MTKEEVTYRNVVAGISAFMLLLAIPKLPYGYYILLRWAVTATALFSIWVASEYECKVWIFVMGGIAILFNPIIPVHLPKGTWIVIDTIVATVFLISIFRIKPKRESQKSEGIQNSEKLVKAGDKAFAKRRKEEIAWNLNEGNVEKLEEERRKRDNAFVKCWDKGANNEELVEVFDLTAEKVKKLKTTLLLKRLKLRRKKKKRLIIITVVLSFCALIIVLRIVGLFIQSRKQQGDFFEEWLERQQQEKEPESDLDSYDKLILGEGPKEELSAFDKLILGQPEE